MFDLRQLTVVLALLACAACAHDRKAPVPSGQACNEAATCEQYCSMGNGIACRQLARQHELGLGTQPDLRKAVRLYQRGCGAGDTSSCVSAAGYLRDGLPAVAEPHR